MTTMKIFPETLYVVSEVLTEDQNNELIAEAERIFKEASDDSDNPWVCNIFTSHNSGDILKNPKFNLLHQTIANHIGKYMDDLKIEQRVGCSEAWFNVGDGSKFQEEHIHPSNHFSAIYYMKAPDGSAGTKFSRPYNNMMQPHYIERTIDTVDWLDISAEERRLVIFRSHIPHSVPQGSNKDLRITHASNWR